MIPHSSHDCLQKVDKKELYLNSLPDRHQCLLTNYRVQMLRKRNCIEQNYKIIQKMIADVDQIFETGPDEESDDNCYHRIHKHLKSSADKLLVQPPKLDTDRVIITLKQIIRDWSTEGAEERAACYGPILNALTDYFKGV